MQALDHTSLRVLGDISAGREADSTYTDAMLWWYAKNTEDTPELSDDAIIAFSIRASRKQSAIIEALLLSNCPVSVISETFLVPERATEVYAELFFDTSVFRTKLDIIEYLDEDSMDTWERDLKLKAVNLGYEFVLFNFANLVPKTAAQKKLVERMFMATAYKAMAMNYNGIKSEVNRQAVKHAELMLKAYDLLVKTNTDTVGDNHDLLAILTTSDEQSNINAPSIGEII